MTDYYVLSQLGPHQKGDVISFSPEQIGAGVDISHLTSIGALRVATPLLDPPPAPTLATAGTGGSVAAGVYTVKISYLTASGETTPSSSAAITTSGATSTLTVDSPSSATGATGWYAYVSQVGGSTLTRQQTSPTPIATNLILTAHPTSSGSLPPGTNTSGEAARSVPAQIQATHAPQGVGVFTNNGVPTTAYAGVAAYGSICWDVSVSPPDCYVQTGTLASPTWVKASYPGVTGDDADGVNIAGGVYEAGATYLPAPLRGLTPDPAYDPTHTFTDDDVAGPDSKWGVACIHTTTWTPGFSGQVTLLPPDDNGVSAELDYVVFRGTEAGVDYPSLDGSGSFDWSTQTTELADSSRTLGDPTGSSATFDCVAGVTYTLALEQYGDATTGRTASLRAFVLSTQPFGGQATPVAGWSAPPAQAIGPGANAWGLGSVAIGGTADNPIYALADASHVTGLSDENVHMADVNALSATVQGSGNRASAPDAHVEGLDNEVLAGAGHVQGHHNRAGRHAPYSNVQGHHATSFVPGEDAHATGGIDSGTAGPQQYSRIVPALSTTDATPTKLPIDGGDGAFPLIMQSNDTWHVLVQIVASRHDTPGTVASWLLSAALTSTATPRLLGTPAVLDSAHDAAAAGWDVALTIGTDTVPDPLTTFSVLEITVTGEADQTIYWVATVHISRVGV